MNPKRRAFTHRRHSSSVKGKCYADSQPPRVDLSIIDFKLHEGRDGHFVKNVVEVTQVGSYRVRLTDATACVFISMLFSFQAAGHSVA